MDPHRSPNLLDEALGLDQSTSSWPLSGRVVLVEDCVETSACFVLYQLIKRSLSLQSSNVVIFLAFSHTFSHLERILRKLGCNLMAQRDNSRFFFFDMLRLQCSGDEKMGKDGLVGLFRKVQNLVSSLPEDKKKCTTIMVDDISLMEVAANGSSDHVLDFLHYCHTLTSEFVGCSLVLLNHKDIYSCLERPTFLLQIEYLADVMVKAEPLATGLASDVHGQLTVSSKGLCGKLGNSMNKMTNFQFRIRENNVEYFYPGSRT